MKIFNTKKVMLKLAATILLMSSSVVYSAEFPVAGNASNGAKAWAENCSRCHNMRSPEELRDDQWITTVFHMRVRGGLTGQETRDIITFLQSSNTKPIVTSSKQVSAISVSDATGKKVYGQTCISCHGADGAGAFPGVPDFNSNIGPLSKSNDVLLKNIANGFQSPGSPMAMPPKGGNPNLTANDIAAVLEYIRAEYGK